MAAGKVVALAFVALLALHAVLGAPIQQKPAEGEHAAPKDDKAEPAKHAEEKKAEVVLDTKETGGEHGEAGENGDAAAPQPETDEVLYADMEDVDWDGYKDTPEEAAEREKRFEEEYQVRALACDVASMQENVGLMRIRCIPQRYLEEMAQDMMNDPGFRDQVIKDLEEDHPDETSRENNDLLRLAKA